MVVRRVRRARGCIGVFATLVVTALGPGCSRASPPARLPVEALPGAEPFDASLRKRLDAAWTARPPGYKPRTRHLRPDGTPMYTNRLFLEPSPYLKQHAHNPVNWYPWGDEAFETARRLRRPVLLSVGYSTCHWCHVMEEESFEDEEIARYMNEKYVAIKVDREERPDVDGVYMAAVQMLTGQGGWPMTVWLTPDRKPFFGGTYFPARDGDRGVSPGFITLLQKLRAIYDQQPDRVTESAARITAALSSSLAPKAGSAPESLAGAVTRAARLYRERFDSTEGGVTEGRKFPSSLPVRFLLRYAARAGDPEARHMAVLTLEKMWAGGIHDQIGGGFHRYSTDAHWLVPHFEKMLYDNALLAMSYLEGYQATGREEFAEVARDVLRYAEQDMAAPEGGFYSATDADSPGPDGRPEEGSFFTWTPAEIESALGNERARVVEAYYGVTPGGNFQGRNILHIARPIEAVARDLRLPSQRVRDVLQQSRPIPYAARGKRPPPHRDEKILAAWNGLMISALARAALVLGEERYARRASQTAEFMLGRILMDGRLRRSYQDGAARGSAFLEDYAFLIAGLLDLYEATGAPRWLREAMNLDHVLESHYEDPKAGAYYLTSDDQERLLAREKPSYDGAEPTGNSVQAMNLLRLYELTANDRYRRRADRTFSAFSEVARQAPTAMSELLTAAEFRLGMPREIVIVTPRSRVEAEPFLGQLRRTYVPNRVLIVAAEGADIALQEKLIPLLEGKTAQGGRTTAYVCTEGVCKLPTADVGAFAEQIRER